MISRQSGMDSFTKLKEWYLPTLILSPKSLKILSLPKLITDDFPCINLDAYEISPPNASQID